MITSRRVPIAAPIPIPALAPVDNPWVVAEVDAVSVDSASPATVSVGSTVGLADTVAGTAVAATLARDALAEAYKALTAAERLVDTEHIVKAVWQLCMPGISLA